MPALHFIESTYVTTLLDVTSNTEHHVRWCKQNRLCVKADFNVKQYYVSNTSYQMYPCFSWNFTVNTPD